MIQSDFARIRNEHRKSYPSSGAEAWDRDAVCDSCDLPFPCTTIQLVDEIDRLNKVLDEVVAEAENLYPKNPDVKDGIDAVIDLIRSYR